MSSYVGFANLPNQVHRKTVKRGFEFTLMVVGKMFSFTTLCWHQRKWEIWLTWKPTLNRVLVKTFKIPSTNAALQQLQPIMIVFPCNNSVSDFTCNCHACWKRTLISNNSCRSAETSRLVVGLLKSALSIQFHFCYIKTVEFAPPPPPPPQSDCSRRPAMVQKNLIKIAKRPSLDFLLGI